MRAKVPKLTDDQVAEFKEAFSLFDRDGDGTITKQELAEMLLAIGMPSEPEEISMVMAQGDQSGNEVIDFPEYLDFMARLIFQSDQEQVFREVFEVFDPDGTGVLSPDNLRRIIQNLGGRTVSRVANPQNV